MNENWETESLLSPTNVQWNRKYYEAGDFVMEIPASQYSPDYKYIYCNKREEVGMIQKVSWSAGTDGKRTVQMSGYFLEKWLDDKIIYPTFYGSGEISAELGEMVDTYKEDINITVDLLGSQTGEKVDFQVTGDELGKKMYETLQTQEMSYKVHYDFVENKLTLLFYKGADHTQESGSDVNVMFSTSLSNLDSPQVDRDESNYKNYFVVAGTGEAEERITVTVDLSNGGYKKKLFVDERQTKYNPDEQTLDQYKLELQQQGLEKALDYQVVENIAFDIKPQGYEYLTEYDLGTKVDVVITDLQMALQARITAIYEVFKEGKHEISVEVGTPIPNKYGNLRL